MNRLEDWTMQNSKHATVIIAALLLCASLSWSAEDGRPVPLEAYGVWDRGDSFEFEDYPFLKGLTFDAGWEEVETEPGQCDWSDLDRAARKAYEHDRFMYISINAGPDAPQWVYEQGVPKVTTDDEKHRGKWRHYPYYLNPKYKFFFFRMIRSLAEHLDGLPIAQHRRIAFIQVKTGCTGDECPYQGKALESKYEIAKNSPAWRTFRLETFALFVDLFQSNPDRRIELLFNSVGGERDEDGQHGYGAEWDWMTSHIKGDSALRTGPCRAGITCAASACCTNGGPTTWSIRKVCVYSGVPRWIRRGGSRGINETCR